MLSQQGTLGFSTESREWRMTRLTKTRKGMAAFMGKDVKQIKTQGGGKWKYMSELDILNISAKFSPYRQVATGISVT